MCLYFLRMVLLECMYERYCFFGIIMWIRSLKCNIVDIYICVCFLVSSCASQKRCFFFSLCIFLEEGAFMSSSSPLFPLLLEGICTFSATRCGAAEPIHNLSTHCIHSWHHPFVHRVSTFVLPARSMRPYPSWYDVVHYILSNIIPFVWRISIHAPMF